MTGAQVADQVAGAQVVDQVTGAHVHGGPSDRSSGSGGSSGRSSGSGGSSGRSSGSGVSSGGSLGLGGSSDGKEENGTHIHDQDRMIKRCEEFYTNLYSTKLPQGQPSMQIQRYTLNTPPPPILPTEVNAAIKRLKRN